LKRIETWVLGTLVGVSLCLFVGLGGYFAYDLALKRGLLAGSAAAAATARPAAPTTLTRAPPRPRRRARRLRPTRWWCRASG